jgi:divalent metal cation (Fe/Co/Zn/Cd) transporter
MSEVEVTRARDLRIGLALESITVGYNILEAILALGIGFAAQSISLETFGLDSIIEVGAGVILIWRLNAERSGARSESVEAVEKRAARWVGGTLFALAAYVFAQSIYSLMAGERPEGTIWGVALALLSLLVMPVLALMKLRVAKRLESHALRADAFETVACAYLSFTLLLGLGANYLFGWWWADPLAALAMVYFIVREAREAWSGEHDEDNEGKGSVSDAELTNSQERG